MPDDAPTPSETTRTPPATPASAGSPLARPGGPTAPATVAPSSRGLRMRGMILATPVMKAMTEMVRLLGAESKEGGEVLKALSIMSRAFGRASGDLERAEVKLLGERAGGMTQPGPEQMRAFQQMGRDRLGRMGLAGATPPPIPPPPVPAGQST